MDYLFRSVGYTAGIVILCIGIGIFGYMYNIYSESQDQIDAIKKHRMDVTTQIFDRKDRLVANVFDTEFRLYAKFDEIPPRLIEVLLAVEDTLFFEHIGVNPDAISRAMVKNIQNLRYSEGGSTLTQQVVKNVALTSERSIKRKIKEAMFAMLLEQQMSKEDIIEIYLNHIFFGHGYYGVRTAALGYFKKTLNELSLKEISMLMALPKAPSTYDPTRNLTYCLLRANAIVERLKEIGWITEQEYTRAIKETPKVYNETLTQNSAPYVVDEVVRQLSAIYPDIRVGGYKVKTTIDLDYQKIAQQALIHTYNETNKRLLERYPNMFEEAHLQTYKIDPQNEQEMIVESRARALNLIRAMPKEEYVQRFGGSLNGAMVVTEPETGNVLALVGGVDYAISPFNRATQARRQFGSSVKPFIYLLAFDRGYSPAWQIPDVPRRFGGRVSTIDLDSVEGVGREAEARVWRPKNVGTYGGMVRLHSALQHSANLATINLVQEVGFDTIYQGIENLHFRNVPPDMSIVLGSLSLSPLDAAGKYSLFSNYGTITTPRLIESVTNAQGEINDNFPTNEETFTLPSQAFLVTNILRDVVNRGTGSRAHLPNIEIAGKTGTSNKNVDGWFCGFSPDVQVVIWMGRDNNLPIGPNETGGVTSAPASAYFFSNLLKIEPGLRRHFPVPGGIMRKAYDDGEFLYTDVSQLPPTQNMSVEDNLIF